MIRVDMSRLEAARIQALGTRYRHESHRVTDSNTNGGLDLTKIYLPPTALGRWGPHHHTLKTRDLWPRAALG